MVTHVPPLPTVQVSTIFGHSVLILSLCFLFQIGVLDIRFTKMEMRNIKQHYAIKFCVKHNENATDIYKKLKQAYGDDSLLKAQVFVARRPF